MAGRSHRNTAERHVEPAPEISRSVRLSRVSERPVRLEVAASPEEREALRERFELEALDSLRATVRLERIGRNETYRLEGDLRAAVTQICVVTLEPVENVVEGRFAMTFVEGLDETGEGEEPDLGEDLDADPPEPLSGEAIDVGEAVVQQFATMLDPYPRAPDATLEAARAGEDADEERSPFAVLEKLRIPGGRGAD